MSEFSKVSPQKDVIFLWAYKNRQWQQKNSFKISTPWPTTSWVLIIQKLCVFISKINVYSIILKNKPTQPFGVQMSWQNEGRVTVRDARHSDPEMMASADSCRFHPHLHSSTLATVAQSPARRTEPGRTWNRSSPLKGHCRGNWTIPTVSCLEPLCVDDAQSRNV